MACLKKIGETQNLRRFNEVANIYFGKVPHKLNYPAFMKVFENSYHAVLFPSMKEN